MKKIRVSASSGTYDVTIGKGAITFLGETVRETTKAKRCVIVSGKNVNKLYGENVQDLIVKSGLECFRHELPVGEEAKSLRCYGELLNYLAEKRFSRTDCLIALGGGVTGDLTGFVAATYQRGIPYIQVPTSLLAAVDSSVGGKTAINLTAGKNQAGAFYQPKAVICDINAFSTLPERELRAGFAEVIKCAVLADADLFDQLTQPYDLENVIETCVRMKADIVAEDEYDTGRMRLLNLGHTFGHAIEQCSAYQLLHGEAVAIGTAMICRAAVRRGFFSNASCDAVIDLLRSFGLPVDTEYSPEDLYGAMLLDKKFAAGKLHLIVPKSIGWCVIEEISPEELFGWLLDGMEKEA